MKNIWQELKKPLFILAPMDDVTDTVFRQLVIKCARPDIFFTEFTNVDAICSEGREHVIHRLQFEDVEHPIVAQLWGNKPENFEKAAAFCAKLGFDGIDINMGCPVHDVMKRGCCAALIDNQPLVKNIIDATKHGSNGLPVSVKTRIGTSKPNTEEWISFLLDQNLDAITIHGRTAKEMSKVPAHWDEIAKAVKLRNDKKSKTVIIGNGDVQSRQDGLEKVQQYGVNGIMIGRAIFQDAWLFAEKPHVATIKESLALLLDHTMMFEKTWGAKKNPIILRRFYKNYVKGFENAAEVRDELMRAETTSQISAILKANNLL